MCYQDCMLFRIVFSLIYLITLEIGIATSFEHIEDSNICSQDKESKKDLNCDFHCMSLGLIDDSLSTSGKNNFDDVSKLKIEFIISNTNFNLEIFPQVNSPPFFS